MVFALCGGESIYYNIRLCAHTYAYDCTVLYIRVLGSSPSIVFVANRSRKGMSTTVLQSRSTFLAAAAGEDRDNKGRALPEDILKHGVHD